MKKIGSTSLVMIVLVSLVLIIISGIIIFGVVGRVTKSVCNGDVNACRESVLIATKAEQAIGLYVPTSCRPPEPYVFKKENPEEINQIIVQEFEKCIFKFHAGEIDFRESEFVTSVLGKGITFEEGKTLCFVCAEFNFDEYMKKKEYLESSAVKDKEGKIVLYQNLFPYASEHETICKRPKEKVLDFIHSFGENPNMDVNFRNIEKPEGIYTLYARIWDPGKGEGARELAENDYETSEKVSVIVLDRPSESKITENCNLVFR